MIDVKIKIKKKKRENRPWSTEITFTKEDLGIIHSIQFGSHSWKIAMEHSELITLPELYRLEELWGINEPPC